MTTLILYVLGLFVLQTLLPACFRYFGGEGIKVRGLIALGPRDSQPPQSLIGERSQRALANMQEALPVFLTLALLHVFRGTDSTQAIHGAWVFLLARVLYIPAYLSGALGI